MHTETAVSKVKIKSDRQVKLFACRASNKRLSHLRQTLSSRRTWPQYRSKKKLKCEHPANLLRHKTAQDEGIV